MPAPIDVHFWPTPNGWKITVMLEELGWPYEVKPVNIGKGEQFEDAFLAISPNNRMPAIVDPEGPDGEPISIFESGAILQYLARKSGRFGGGTERQRIEVDEWVFWQVANVGPMAGQAHHFLRYAPEEVPYARKRYVDEVNRLYGVLDWKLRDREFIVGDYSIADIASYPWVKGWERQGQTAEDMPNVIAWLERCAARPAVEKGCAVGKEWSMDLSTDKDAQSVLFGQRARKRSG
ncbi:MAG TPA: glutathione S-transferase N-terminal domain-containing protein [Thermohalobaculum sp.]|nr:glutathione S-transferase N-terminal domain-containing protein [Thermohalobaculum sp.]